jgi:hypothetical protein
MALELPFGVKPVNPVAVDFWSGPYSGILTQEAVDAANSGIEPGIRYVGQKATLVVSGVSQQYWYASGVSDSDLVPFSSESSGNFFTNFQADNGTVTATSPNDTIRIVNATKTGAKEITTGSGVGGGGNREYANVTTDISMSDTDDVIFANSSSNPVNVYIPTAASVGGKEVTIKMVAGSAPVTVLASGSETIDGQASRQLLHTYESITLISNNTNWYII